MEAFQRSKWSIRLNAVEIYGEIVGNISVKLSSLIYLPLSQPYSFPPPLLPFLFCFQYKAQDGDFGKAGEGQI